MRVYIDADAILTTRPSGIGSMTVQLIHALSRNGIFTKHHQIILLAPFNKAHLLKQWHFSDAVKVKKLPVIGRVLSLLYKLHLVPPMDLIAGKGIYLFPNFRAWPLLFSKSITYIHDVSFREYPEYVEERNLRFLLAHIRQWLDKSDIIVTVSNHAAAEIERYYPGTKEKIKVVYNGVNERFTPLSESQSLPILDKYGLSYKSYLMFLSNLEPRKNIDGLLEAYRDFVADSAHADVKLLLVGGMGWKNNEILQRIDGLNTKQTSVIVPKSYVPDDDLPALLSGAAGLIHPAHYEGFGISPLQAMACGTQVVVANNSSLPEVVGDAGIFINSKSQKDIRKGMEMAYNNRYTINTKGIRRAKKFSWDASAEQLVRLIVSLEDL